DFVVERVKEGHTIIGLYPATEENNLSLFAKWREANGR
ncbi:ribonuclease activity regulator RraA, partial [Rhizobium sp. Td3]